MQNTAEYWRAKYEGLAAGIDDPTLIDNAERLANAAWGIALSVPVPYAFAHTVEGMLRLINVTRPTPDYGALAALIKPTATVQPTLSDDELGYLEGCRQFVKEGVRFSTANVESLLAIIDRLTEGVTT